MIELLINKSREAQQQNIYCQETFSCNNVVSSENEFLFFIKPEITGISCITILHNTFKFILAEINQFQLRIKNIKALSLGYIEKYDLIANHYGIINKLLNNPLLHLSMEARQKFTENFGKQVEEANLKGSLQYLKENPGATPDDLSWLVENLDYYKLAPGTYVQKLASGGQEEKPFEAYSAGRALMENFTNNQVSAILSNIDLEVDGKRTSIFDLTEEIHILKKYTHEL